MVLTGGLRFDPEHGFVPGDLSIEDGYFTNRASGAIVDVTDCYLIPGLTDLHFHGCKGADFSDGDAEGLAVMAEYEGSRGVTQICPAGMTLPEEQLSRICRTAAAHRKEGKKGAHLVGIYLEGPFLAPAKKGAQNGAWLHTPDITLLRKLEEEAEGLVKLVAVAPELEGSMHFIREASRTMTVSLGHTAATYDIASAAIEAGARQVTHLFNAMLPLGHREPGTVGAASDCEEVNVEMICDGIHLHPAIIRGMFRMFGKDRVILVSDTMRAAGMADGKYTLGGQDVWVKGRLATLADGTIAGSVTDLMACMCTAVSYGISLADAVTAAAVNPAKAIGIYDDYGSLDAGKHANLAVLDADLNLKAVLCDGELLFGAL